MDGWLVRFGLGVGLFMAGCGLLSAQPAPAASGARILLLPRKIVSGERATLAVLDLNGRLTPGVNVTFSDGEKVTTDVTGRALFVAPLQPGTIYATIEGRPGRVASTILAREDSPSGTIAVTAAPRLASTTDRFELSGHGFCGDADANEVTVGGGKALVLASSPASLAVLPPSELGPGSAPVRVSCGPKSSKEFLLVLVSLDLESSSVPLAPGEHRSLVVRVRGTTAKVTLEARDLAPDVAELQGGGTVRVTSSGGTENAARLELVGKRRGSFMISIRLVAPLGEPKI